jgi:hypothetical protein
VHRIGIIKQQKETVDITTGYEMFEITIEFLLQFRLLGMIGGGTGLQAVLHWKYNRNFIFCFKESSIKSYLKPDHLETSDSHTVIKTDCI